MYRVPFLKLAAFVISFFGLFFVFSVFASAAVFTCRFSCIQRIPVQAVCCSREGGCPALPAPGSVGGGDEEARRTENFIRESAGRGVPIADYGYSIDPVFFRLSQREQRIEAAENTCSTSCVSACMAACGGRLATAGSLTGDQTACLGTGALPAYVRRYADQCRSLAGGGGAPVSEFIREGAPASEPPVCSPVQESSSSQGSGSGQASGQACNPPAIPENAPPKKCVFYCMQPGVGSDGNGRANLETGENGAGQRCLNVNVVRRVGTRACSSEGECACVEECKSTCGSEGGKSKCYIAPGNADQILACSGAGNISQAKAPKCEVVTDTVGSSRTLDNPLHTEDIGELIARFIRALSGIAGAMALLMFVVGGVMWMTAEGSDRVSTAQTILKNASIGLILIFFAYSIVSLFLSVLGL